MTTNSTTTEQEISILKAALFGRFGIATSLAVIEECLEKSTKAAPADAPFPLVGEEAALWHRAQKEAYRHALDMITLSQTVRDLEHSFPSDFRTQIHEGPVREGDVFRAKNGDSITALTQMPPGVMQVRMQGKSLRLGDFKNSELKALPRIGRADYSDGSYSTPYWMYADGARSRIRDLTKMLAEAEARNPAAEFPDWRHADGDSEEVSPAASGNGRLELVQAGWGAALRGTTPSGKNFTLHFEFDADTPKFTVYPPSRDSREVTDDEPVLHAAVTDEGVIVSSGYGNNARIYSSSESATACRPFSGAEAMKATRQPLYGLHKATVLQELGFEFGADPDQVGKWTWSDPMAQQKGPFDAAKEAVDDAWNYATQQVMVSEGLTQERWDAMHFDEKSAVLRDAFSVSDLEAPAPR